jgi:hypothetical protein
MRFLGGFYVFPGGTVHRDDYSPAMLARCRNLSAAEAKQILKTNHEPDEALGHWVAVARELFEEVGILLCVETNGAAFHAGDSAMQQRIEQKRQATVNKQLKFADFLDSEKLYCDLACMLGRSDSQPLDETGSRAGPRPSARVSDTAANYNRAAESCAHFIMAAVMRRVQTAVSLTHPAS